MKKIVVIPARLASTRLPQKLLLDLGGKSVIQRVFDQCKLATKIDDVYIAVDHLTLKNHCLSFTDNVSMTSAENKSGTDRIAEAVTKIECDVVINVQGDEPLIDPNLIDQLSESFNNSSVKMCSAMVKITDNAEITDPNTVKVITDINNNAIYFSRLPIPYNRDSQANTTDSNYFKHIGIYAYTNSFISAFYKMNPSKYEQIEKLEQLRVLENGYSIKMIETNHNAVGIDTIEDYNAVKIKFTDN